MKKAKPMKKPRRLGRPRGKEETTIVNVRMPVSLLDRLDAYLEHRESTEPESINRGMVIRQLLEQLLTEEGF